MNRAMRDLLDSTLDGWYTYLASWEAPGELGASGCELCSESLFSRLDGLGDWPHDIVHRLVRDLTTAVRHVHHSLQEIDEGEPDDRLAHSAVLARHAEFLVLSAIETRRDEMIDVLEQCIEPALDSYLRAECERGLLEIFAADDRDHPVY